MTERPSSLVIHLAAALPRRLGDEARSGFFESERVSRQSRSGITEPRASTVRPRTGIVFYDGECAFCRVPARCLGGVLRRRGFALQTLQSAAREPRVSRALGLSPNTGFDSMWVLPAAGPPLSGADGIIHLARRVWWARPLVWLSHAPFGLSALWAGYRWVARHRSCAGGVCRVKDTTQLPHHDSTLRRLHWAPLSLLVTVPLSAGALAAGNLLEPWVWMWTIAIALFFGFKVRTWSRARTTSVSLRRSLAYFLAWVGMDADEFLSSEPLPCKPATAEWRQGWLHAVAGVGLLSLAVPRLVTVSAVLASWVGLVGLILVLHFGLFHLLALGWQVLGVPARPLMQKPLAARSLG